MSPTSKFKVLGGENRESRFQQKKIVLSQNGLLLLNLKSFGMWESGAKSFIKNIMLSQNCLLLLNLKKSFGRGESVKILSSKLSPTFKTQRLVIKDSSWDHCNALADYSFRQVVP